MEAVSLSRKEREQKDIKAKKVALCYSRMDTHARMNINHMGTISMNTNTRAKTSYILGYQILLNLF